MKTSPWFVPLSGNSSAPLRLFAFPFAGGSAVAYAPWQHWMPAEVALIGVQLPGRATRIAEPCIDDMDAMLAALMPHLLPLLDRPYQLFGHSNGALMVFAVLQRLLQLGAAPPEAIVLSAKRSPTVAHQGEALSTLSEEKFLLKLKELNGTPQELLDHPELMGLLSPMIRADFRLGESFATRALDPALADIPALIIAGQDDAMPTAEVFAWQSLLPKSSLVTLAGGHFCIHTDPLFPQVMLDFINTASGRTGIPAMQRQAA